MRAAGRAEATPQVAKAKEDERPHDTGWVICFVPNICGSIPGLEVLFGEFAKLVGYGPKTFQSD